MRTKSYPKAPTIFTPRGCLNGWGRIYNSHRIRENIFRVKGLNNRLAVNYDIKGFPGALGGVAYLNKIRDDYHLFFQDEFDRSYYCFKIKANDIETLASKTRLALSTKSTFLPEGYDVNDIVNWMIM